MPPTRIRPLRILRAVAALAIFDGRVVGPVLVAILFYPQRLQKLLPAKVYQWVTSPVTIRALKVLLGLSIARALNKKLSEKALNYWRSDVKFVKSQEIVLISGGSSGLGRVMAKDFAKIGVKVVVLDINPPKEPLPSGVYFYQADVASPSSIASAAAEIRKDHGNPTVLINNAGIYTANTILGGTEENIRRIFDVNTISHFTMAREFVPAMVKKNHGHVVTIASMASYVVLAQNVDYSCTKASALAFHEGLHAELISRYGAPDVRTTVVNPSWIRTPLIEKLLERPEFNDPVLEPEDVSSAIVKQVLSGKGGHLILPPGLGLASSIRAWPSWLQTGLRNKLASVLDFVPNE